MDENTALQTAKVIAASRCSLSIHHGDAQDAIRITGCTPEEATAIGQEIASKVNGSYRSAAGFSCVWLSPEHQYLKDMR